ncbi:unnamed protein product [Kluyveromyces dobzhanskii CBS 2104]|uniref:2-dehydropantoate 2-reductase n=1 Tax=Kluyveromyces dobzhanskii CBS 2104 TaxID=1427455 RepID=A0A0A8L2K1_9SACH|nr:unnamed protein product [Kluyveromyces dobzhanskii CBS 2104]
MTVYPSIHILGFGAIGSLIGVHLQKYGGTKVIPLFRSLERLNEFKKNKCKTSIKPLFDLSLGLVTEQFTSAACPETFKGKIDNLIITCKTYQTADALRPFLPYLHNESNIIMIQNGLGVTELLKEEVFTGTDLKPNLFQGVIGHGIFQDKEIKSQYNFAGFVNCKISKLPEDDKNIIETFDQLNEWKKNDLIKALLALENSLAVVHMTYQELLLGQLEKFLVNCCINSVTSIVDCINGELANCGEPVFTSIIEEALNVFQTAYKPLFEYPQIFDKTENGKLPKLDVAGRLNLDVTVKSTIEMGCIINGSNSSSMRQDVLNLRDTEIDYINGYIVTLCRKFSLPESDAKVNRTIQQLVKLRLRLNQTRHESQLA